MIQIVDVLHKRGGHAELRQQRAQRVEGATVHVIGGDNTAAALSRVEQRIGDGRHAGGDRHGFFGAIQFGDALLQERDRGIGYARIQEARHIAIGHVMASLRILQPERRVRVNDRRHRIGVGGRVETGMHLRRVELMIRHEFPFLCGR